MIDTKELRIGNLIYWDIPSKKDVFHEIVGVTWGRINTIPISLGDNLEEYKPIKLTEELLLKFGFLLHINKDSGCGHAKIKNMSLWLDNGKIIYHTNHGMTVLTKVHQLQNLYFSLTGKELKTKN